MKVSVLNRTPNASLQKPGVCAIGCKISYLSALCWQAENPEKVRTFALHLSWYDTGEF
jgi:hypothetical protein